MKVKRIVANIASQDFEAARREASRPSAPQPVSRPRA